MSPDPYSPDPNRPGVINEVIHHPQIQLPAYGPGGTTILAYWDPYAQYVLDSELEQRVYDFVSALVAGGLVGSDAEYIRDTVAAALVGTAGLTFTVDDAGNTITGSISSLTVSQVNNLQTLLDSKATLSGGVVPDSLLPSRLQYAKYLFVNASAPLTPTSGQMWADISTLPPVIKYWDGSAWQTFVTGGGGGGSTMTVVDNSDGTATITDTGGGSSSVVDNADGTATVTA